MDTPTVHILATVRNPALLDAALLVFKTVRIGFPTAHVHVQANGLEIFAIQEVQRAAQRVGATYAYHQRTMHDLWIESLIYKSSAPFWICDTDVVFFERVEHWEFSNVIAGRLEPEFAEEWTQSTHVERLHTALMWINAPRLRQEVRQWMGHFPPGFFSNALMNLVRMQFVPVKGEEPLFYDSCAGIWQALGGQAFTEEQNQAFEHLHCATYSDLVKAPGLADLARVHKMIFADPAAARGMQRDQTKYYQSRRKPARRNELVVPEKGPAYAVQSRSRRPVRPAPSAGD